MDTSTKILIGAGVVLGGVALVMYTQHTNLAAKAESERKERAKKDEELFLHRIVSSYRMDHLLLKGSSTQIDYNLLDIAIHRIIAEDMQFNPPRRMRQVPLIKKQLDKAVLVGALGTEVTLIVKRPAKS